MDKRENILGLISSNFALGSWQLEDRVERISSDQRIDLRNVQDRTTFVKESQSLLLAQGISAKVYKVGRTSARIVLQHKEHALRFFLEETRAERSKVAILADKAHSYQIDRELLICLPEAVSVNVGSYSPSIGRRNPKIVQYDRGGIPATLRLLSNIELFGGLPENLIIPSAKGQPWLEDAPSETALAPVFSPVSASSASSAVETQDSKLITQDAGHMTQNPDGLCLTPDSLIATVSDAGSKGRVIAKPLIELKAGDMVLPLNEATGKLESHRVNALLDMGVKPVYRLRTKSGRELKTTLNHPYLTKSGWRRLEEIKMGEEITVTNLAFVSQPLDGFVNETKDDKKISCLSMQRGNLFKESKEFFHRKVSSLKDRIKGAWFYGFGAMQKNHAPAAKIGLMSHDNMRAALAFYKKALLLQGTDNLFAANMREFGHTETSTSLSSTSTSDSGRGNLSSLSDQRYSSIASLILDTASSMVSPWEAQPGRAGTWTENPPSASGSIMTLNRFNISQSPNSKTTISSLISQGEKSEYFDIFWNQIVSIEPLGPQQVYDIEVEGTHNFVAEGIIAHNTYQIKSPLRLRSGQAGHTLSGTGQTPVIGEEQNQEEQKDINLQPVNPLTGGPASQEPPAVSSALADQNYTQNYTPGVEVGEDTQELGGIDLSDPNIEVILEKESIVANLNPADLKVLRVARLRPVRVRRQTSSDPDGTRSGDEL